MPKLLANLLIWLVERTEGHEEPEPPKVRALCSYCLVFHDGHGRFCECCEFVLAPPWEVEEQIRERIDSIEYISE